MIHTRTIKSVFDMRIYYFPLFCCFYLVYSCQQAPASSPVWQCQKRSFSVEQDTLDETMEQEQARLVAANILEGTKGEDYRVLAERLSMEASFVQQQLTNTFECRTCLWECRFQDQDEQSPVALKIKQMQEDLLQDLSFPSIGKLFLATFSPEDWDDPIVKFTFLGLLHNLSMSGEEKGLDIKLPAWTDGVRVKTKERNILKVRVNAEGSVLVRDKELPFDELGAVVKKFIINPNAETDLADTPHHAIIALSNERDTPYDRYLKVYQIIREVYTELWNDYAMTNYGKPYDESLPDSIKNAIRQAIPFVVSEAEPTGFD